MPPRTNRVAHVTEVIKIAGRHYPRCSCGWAPITVGGFEKEADAGAQCKIHKDDVKRRNEARATRANHRRVFQDALAEARRR